MAWCFVSVETLLSIEVMLVFEALLVIEAFEVRVPVSAAGLSRPHQAMHFSEM